MTTAEALKKIQTDEGFVYLKRYKYSLKRLLDRYPEGCPDKVIAAALMITEEDVEAEYERIVVKLRELIGA